MSPSAAEPGPGPARTSARTPAPALGHQPGPAPALPSLDEVLAGARVVRLPLRTRFRGVTEREALLVEGPRGWTEFSPFVEYGPDEAAAWLAATLDFGWGAEPTVRADRVEVNATLPAVAAEDVPAVLSRYRGCRTVKVKVAEPGGSLDDDVARVAAARRWVGDDGAVRVDANAAWTVDEALAAAAVLAPYDLQYLEQPCASVPELAELRRRLGGSVLVAADESVRRAEDPLAVARAGAADLLVVKAQPLGGIAAALRIVRAAGLPVVVSSAIDTSVGLSMGAHLAAAAPGVAYACGLGTAALLAADVTTEPLEPVDGSIAVRRVDVDPDLLRRHAAEADRRSWWLERVRSAWAAAVERSAPDAAGAHSPE